MLTRVPLDIVHLVVRHAVDRDAYDEDWPSYQRRLAQLCLVCRFFRNAVQPVLWKTLRVRTLEQFHKVAGREGRNRHLLKHVEEFRGGPALGEEHAVDAVLFLRYYLPQLQSISLSAFEPRDLALEPFALFDNLRSLTLHHVRLDPIPAGFSLPQLETLSLIHAIAQTATFCDLFRPECTPGLRHLALLNVDDSQEPYFNPPSPDLSRLRVAQIGSSDDAYELYATLRFDRTTLLSLELPTDTFTGVVPFETSFRQPDFVHLGRLPDSFFDRPDWLPYNIFGLSIRLFLHKGIPQQAKAIFLPDEFADTTLSRDWTLRKMFFLLLDACCDNNTPVVLYNAHRDLEGALLTVLMRHIERMDNSAYHERLRAQTMQLRRVWEAYSAEIVRSLTAPPDSRDALANGPTSADCPVVSSRTCLTASTDPVIDDSDAAPDAVQQQQQQEEDRSESSE